MSKEYTISECLIPGFLEIFNIKKCRVRGRRLKPGKRGKKQDLHAETQRVPGRDAGPRETERGSNPPHVRPQNGLSKFKKIEINSFFLTVWKLLLLKKIFNINAIFNTVVIILNKVSCT